MLNIAGDRVTIQENVVTNNNSVGIALVRLPPAIAVLDPLVDPLPDDNAVRANLSIRNGARPDVKLAPLTGADLLWDSSGVGNCWSGNIFLTSFPGTLPTCQ